MDLAKDDGTAYRLNVDLPDCSIIVNGIPEDECFEDFFLCRLIFYLVQLMGRSRILRLVCLTTQADGFGTRLRTTRLKTVR